MTQITKNKTFYFINDYSTDQFTFIRLGKKDNVDISYFENTNFDSEQMRQIYLGLLQNLNVGIYAHYVYSCEQMEQLRKGLADGIDVEIYNDSSLSPLEMKITRERMVAEMLGKHSRPKALQFEEANSLDIDSKLDDLTGMLDNFDLSEFEEVLESNEPNLEELFFF